MATPQQEAVTKIDEISIKAFSSHYQPGSPRIASLDAIKGVAVLFGLIISIYVWGGFSDGMQNQLIGQSNGIRHSIYVLASFFFEGKMRGLISLAFGAGMILFLLKSHPASSVSNGELLVRRSMWLMVFGVVNAFVFLWPQDVLFHLGIMGLLLFPFPRMNTRWLFISVVIISLIGVGKNYWYFADDQKAYGKYVVIQKLEKKFSADSAARMKTKDSSLFKKRQAGAAGVNDSIANSKINDSLAKKAGDTLTRKQKDEKQAWEGIAKRYKYEAKNDSGNIKALQANSYSKNWDQILQQSKNRESTWFYQNGVWEFAALILLGMFLFKIGFFSGRFSQGQYMIMATSFIILGLLCAWYRLHFQKVSITDYTLFVKTRAAPSSLLWPFERAFLVTGIAAKIVWATQSRMFSRFYSIFVDVGRLALTNYLMQSVFLSIFFYGYGMGYFARIGHYKLYFLVAEVCVVQIVFSVFWLRYYYFGPAEWLLTSLMYKKKMPFRRKETETELFQEQPLPSAI